tara:strand:+ start:179 stop:352 length:174 start_codon:yes stop_codon:yes gene_type:complete
MDREITILSATEPMTKEEIVNVLIQDMEELRDPETRWELNDANIDAHIFYIKELANV